MTAQVVTAGLRAATSAAAALAPLHHLDREVGRLLAIPVEERLDALDHGARFLLSARGKVTCDELVDELVAAGYPEASARKEVDLLPFLLGRAHLEAVVDNPTVLPHGRDLLDGQHVRVGSGVTMAAHPVGPVVVIGSGNAFLPAVAATTQALLCGCPVALRGSRLNQRVLERLVHGLRSGGGPGLRSLLSALHLFFVDHRDEAERAALHDLLGRGAFGAAVLWGGGQMIDELLPVLARNPHHPVPIPMEPLTGVAVATERWLLRGDRALEEAADDLADAVALFGQQMCSSPTEALVVGPLALARRLGDELGRALDRHGEVRGRRLDDRRAMLLDRARDRCEELGSDVLVPSDGSPRWTVVVSEGTSAFERPGAGPPLPIHDRHAFLELVAVPTLEAAAERIATLPQAPCHAGIKQVQTLIRLCHLPDAQRLVDLLRGRGGVHRVVPPDHAALRHPLEPFDGQHLTSLLVRRTLVL